MTESIEFKIKDFARTNPLNRMPDDKDQPIFDEPLVKYADGDDPLFNEFKSIIAPTHLTPREALALATNKNTADLPPKISVISWILPITLATRESNRQQNKTPSKLWGMTRWYGEKFSDALREYVVKTLNEMGHIATAPAIQPYFKTFRNEKGPYSNWSERHVAYVTGQGTFSLSDGFITEKGIAHRCASVVTDIILTPSKRTAATPYSNCLYYVNKSCKTCIERCPGGAITENGHDKNKCQEYATTAMKQLREELKIGNAGCGLCQTKVPCEFKNPTKK
jgi:epoxyqueuosine reductase QueG